MIILAFAENSIQLVPDGTMLLHLVTIVVMVAVLDRTLFRPINKVLAEREAQTAGRASEAKKLKSDVEQSLSRYERGLRDARAKGYQFVESQRTEAMKSRDRELTSTREEVRSLVANEKAEIERQATAARHSLSSEAVVAARDIGARILHRPLASS